MYSDEELGDKVDINGIKQCFPLVLEAPAISVLSAGSVGGQRRNAGHA